MIPAYLITLSSNGSIPLRRLSSNNRHGDGFDVEEDDDGGMEVGGGDDGAGGEEEDDEDGFFNFKNTARGK